VKKSLENYPYKVVACELIKGLKFGFPLNYSGPRSPITSKNLKSVAVALGALVNEPAIVSISTTPFIIAPASTDPLLDMSELKSLCSFLSHSVKKGLSKSKIVGSFLRGRYVEW
jgi:hypothetical protein